MGNANIEQHAHFIAKYILAHTFQQPLIRPVHPRVHDIDRRLAQLVLERRAAQIVEEIRLGALVADRQVGVRA